MFGTYVALKQRCHTAIVSYCYKKHINIHTPQVEFDNVALLYSHNVISICWIFMHRDKTTYRISNYESSSVTPVLGTSRDY